MSTRLDNFKEILDKEGELFYTNVGFSMYPLIREREDILHIKKSDIYKKGDIVLYYSSSDKYVLHRIIKIKKDKYILAGDYNYFKDKPITRDQILGILVSIKKKDGSIIELSKDKKVRKFFYTYFFLPKALIQYGMKILHLRKVR